MKTENYTVIGPTSELGSGVQLGIGCIIENDVIIGDNVKIGHRVILKAGTRIGDNVVLGDCVKTTGLCIIGNDVAIRTDSCISKGVIIEDKAFIGAGVMTSHTKHIHHHRPSVTPVQLCTRIGYGAVIGSRSNLMAGVRIDPGVVVGYGSNVMGDCYGWETLWYGNPARLQAQSEHDPCLIVPMHYEAPWFDRDLVNKYLPHLVL